MKRLLTILFAVLLAVICLITISVGQANAAFTFHSGFETGDLTEWDSSAGTVAVSAAQKNTGGYSLYLNPSDVSAYVSNTSVDVFYQASMYIYIVAAPPSADIYFFSGSWKLYLTTDRQIDLYEGSTKRADGTTVLDLNTWYRISVTVNSTDAHGYYWINGVAEGDYDGTNDKLGLTNIWVGNAGAANTVEMYLDDFGTSNTTATTADVGDIRVINAVPAADSATNDEWQVTGGGAGDTYAEVDEVTASTADYAFGEADGTLVAQGWTSDTLANLVGDIDSVAAISSWFYYATAAGGGVDEYFTYMRDNGTDYSTSIDDPKIPTWVNRYDAVMPNGGGAWTEARADAYEIGMATDDSGKDIWCYAAYKMIAFEVATGGTPDISNTPSTYGFGTVAISTTPSTGLTYFTVTNNSGAAVTITISAIDFTGGNGWTLSDTATPDADTAGLKAGLEGGDYTIIVKKTLAYNILVSGLADSATQKWGLKLYVPTSHSDGVAKTTIVTLTAVLD